jgi:hypothetical protein
MTAPVPEEEYLKFKQQLLGDVPLGSLSCDELAERIRVWQDEHGDDHRGEYDGEKVAKMKAKVKRQHKRESKVYVREQRGGVPFPVRSEEVQTELSVPAEIPRLEVTAGKDYQYADWPPKLSKRKRIEDEEKEEDFEEAESNMEFIGPIPVQGCIFTENDLFHSFVTGYVYGMVWTSSSMARRISRR